VSDSTDGPSKTVFRVALSAIVLAIVLLYGVAATKRTRSPVPQADFVLLSMNAAFAQVTDGGIGKPIQPTRGQGAGVV